MNFLFFLQADNVTAKGETVETVPEPIGIEYSSIEPLPHKKKLKNIDVGARKFTHSPKVALTPKTMNEKKDVVRKSEKSDRHN